MSTDKEKKEELVDIITTTATMQKKLSEMDALRDKVMVKLSETALATTLRPEGDPEVLGAQLEMFKTLEKYIKGTEDTHMRHVKLLSDLEVAESETEVSKNVVDALKKFSFIREVEPNQVKEIADIDLDKLSSELNIEITEGELRTDPMDVDMETLKAKEKELENKKENKED